MNLVSDDDKITIGCYKCPICQSTKKYINNELGFLSILTETPDDKMEEMHVPCIFAVCKSCGFIMQFSPATFKG